MDVDALRAMAQGVMDDVIGVPITVTRPAPDNSPIASTGVWLAAPLDEPRPVGTDFPRRDPRKVMAIARSSAFLTLPRGTTILAPELIGGVVKTWKVDGLERVEVDEWRVVVVPV